MKNILLSLIFTSIVLSCNGQYSSQLMGGVSPVVVPTLPKTLDFAGEEVPLANYDVRESLEEDLMVTMYMHSRSMTTLRSTKRYFEIIVPMLKEAGIPEDFKYLAMAESNLNPEAISSAKAGGLWQIMPTTGKEGGLEVNSYVDERYNIEKATKVAIKYFKTAYAKFGSWTLVAASYNVGIAGVSRRLATQGVDNYYDLFLPTETMRYVYRILSFKLAEQYPDCYGFILDEDSYYPPYKVTEVEVGGTNIKWSEVAKKHGTTYKLLRELNPWMREYTHPNSAGKRYKIKIPVEGSRTTLNQ